MLLFKKPWRDVSINCFASFSDEVVSTFMFRSRGNLFLQDIPVSQIVRATVRTLKKVSHWNFDFVLGPSYDSLPKWVMSKYVSTTFSIFSGADTMMFYSLILRIPPVWPSFLMATAMNTVVVPLNDAWNTSQKSIRRTCSSLFLV
jgi:hypothetical protein